MERPATSTLIAFLLVGTAAIAAVFLSRAEPIPGALTAPERSAASRAPDPEPAAETEAANAEAGGEAEAADEPPRGRALTRQDLELGMLQVRAHARSCRSEGAPPLVLLKISIAPSGQVTSVVTPAELRGTRAAECISHAIRTATFPSWSAPPVPSVEWSYPLRLDGDD